MNRVALGLDGVLETTPRFRLQWEEMQQSYVLLYPEGMVKLSLSAAEVLKRCDGKHTVAELLNSLKAQFPRGEGLEQDVRAFLEVAYELGWIRNRPQN